MNPLFFWSSTLSILILQSCASPQRSTSSTDDNWTFAVSGDSRNCGDVVMPAIAASVKTTGSVFYWHLGDFRWGKSIDEDIAQSNDFIAHPWTQAEYVNRAWPDFIEYQLGAFKTFDIPVYLARGNHESVKHTLGDYQATFAPWLTQSQANVDAPKSYYKFERGNVAFVTLDNATPDQFDTDQMAWYRATLAELNARDEIKSIVVGMHEALPYSLSFSHSMSEHTGDQSDVASTSGQEVYTSLLDAKKNHKKNIYILASHSHFYMENIYNTQHWLDNGGELPGWIVGTAGAFRYALPPEPDRSRSRKAMTKVYGYLVGSVNSADGTIQFDFKQLGRGDIPAATLGRYTHSDQTQPLIDYCIDKNAQ